MILDPVKSTARGSLMLPPKHKSRFGLMEVDTVTYGRDREEPFSSKGLC